MRHFTFIYICLICFLPSALFGQGLSEVPTLRLDPDMHTARIVRADTDATGQYVVTGSYDKTVRIWSGADGRLLDTIPLPIGAGEIGKARSVAISPDGALIAVGGWTRWSDEDKQEQIYIYDRVARKQIERIDGLPSNVLDLAFSPDGRRLAATLGAANGVRLFDAQNDWREIAADGDYGDSSYGVDFARDGRFASTSLDGKLRLYRSKGELRAVQNTRHGQPFGIAFHPDGDRIAVGYLDSTDVDVFASDDLRLLYSVDTAGINNGDLSTLSWSADGEHLYAGGRFGVAGERPVLVWGDKGQGPRKTLSGGQNTLMSILPLADGDVIVAAQDPWLGRLTANGDEAWKKQILPVQADFRGQERELLLSRDGTQVGFGFGVGGADPAWFDVGSLALAEGVATELSPPDQDSLKIEDWQDKFNPSLSGVAISLDAYEQSRSLAIAPDGASFVLGTEWSLRAYDSSGEQIWRRTVPGVVWGVNISQDGRYIVAAYGDGTIRWHRPEDGAELLAFFPFEDKRNWVIWEPDGRFASTPGARGSLRWHVNKGWDEIPQRLPAHQIPKSSRPEVMKRILSEGGTMQAIYAAEQVERNAEFLRLTGASIAPGAKLHTLTIGVSDYGPDAPNLALDWADQDAADLHAALATQTDDWPYQPGFTMALRNGEVTKENLMTQLAKIRDRMKEAPHKDNLAVISFSGHGMVLGDGPGRGFYLLPHDFRNSSEAAMRGSGISAQDLKVAVAEIAQYGRVLVLLDACRSGAVDFAGDAAIHDAGLLVQQMAMHNVSVVTSSSGTEVSVEVAALRNGAFTEVVLEALGHAGDANEDGMVSLTEFFGYVTSQVRALTMGAQRPKIEMRFDGNLFASRN